MSQFGSLDANQNEQESNKNVSAFLNTINSIPIMIANNNAPNRMPKTRTISNSLGMFDMEGVDDLNNQSKPSYHASEEEEEDDDDEEARNHSNHSSDSDREVNDGDDHNGDDDEEETDDDEHDDDVEEAEQAEEDHPDLHIRRYRKSNDENDAFCVGSFRVGSLAKHSYLECLESEENNEKVSNLPIKIKSSKNLIKSRKAHQHSKDAQMKQYAQSLPISIPNWKPINNHHSVEDEDLDWMSVKDNPECIAESIKALARSVRDGTEMFGDLPTRKFTASDLVKARPN